MPLVAPLVAEQGVSATATSLPRGAPDHTSRGWPPKRRPGG
jgi:hypothetical protein